MINFPWQQQEKKQTNSDPKNSSVDPVNASAQQSNTQDLDGVVSNGGSVNNAPSAGQKPSNLPPDSGSAIDPFEQGGLPAESSVSAPVSESGQIPINPVEPAAPISNLAPEPVQTEHPAPAEPVAPATIENPVPTPTSEPAQVSAASVKPAAESNIGQDAVDLENQVVPAQVEQAAPIDATPESPTNQVPTTEETQEGINNMFKPQEETTNNDVADLLATLPEQNVGTPDKSVYTAPESPSGSDAFSSAPTSSPEPVSPQISEVAPDNRNIPVQETPAEPVAEPSFPPSESPAPVFPPTESNEDPNADQSNMPSQQTQNPPSTPPAQNQGWQ